MIAQTICGDNWCTIGETCISCSNDCCPIETTAESNPTDATNGTGTDIDTDTNSEGGGKIIELLLNFSLTSSSNN